MAYKKIDADAVNANQPFDAFVLQGLGDNLKEARANRVRRASFAWPVDNRPVLSGNPTSLIYPLFIWPASRRCKKITVTIRHTVSDASVRLAIGRVVGDEFLVPPEEYTTVAAGSTSTEFEVNVDGLQGNVPIYLSVFSELAGDEQTTTITQSDMQDFGFLWKSNRLTLPGGHSITLLENDGDRWVMYFKENSSTVNGIALDDLYVKHQVIETDSGWGVWFTPGISGTVFSVIDAIVNGLDEFGETGQLTLAFQTIGKTEISGISVYESEIAEFDDLQSLFYPARSPIAGNVGKLYIHENTIATTQTRVHHIGPTFDPDNFNSLDTDAFDLSQKVVSLWGEGPVPLAFGGGYKPMAAAWAGSYPRNNLNGGSSRRRNRLRASGLMVVATPDGEAKGLVLKVRASVYSWGGTKWNGSSSNGTDLEVPVSGVAGRRGGGRGGVAPHETGYLLHFCDDDRDHLHQYLRGGILRSELGLKEIVQFDVDVEDEQTTADNRMLRLDARIENMGELTGTVKVYCLTCTVWEEEGSYGA